MHWADVFADKLQGDQVISTGISPSGPIHVGNMREILTGDITHKAVLEKGLRSRFIYLADDIDPLRKRYPFLDEKYEEYVGMPLYRIPAPEGDEQYSEYFLRPYLETLEKIDVHVEVIRTHKLYRDGILADVTRTAMERRNEIRGILSAMSGRALPENWFPYNPICEKCGKINSATVVSFDFPEAAYRCRCGHEGVADVRTDAGKLPWRVEWPAKWYALGVTVESFGKDHAAAGSSYDTGKEIIEKIYGREAPKGIVYEHIFLKGKGAMHSSKGVVIAASDMVKFSPPEIIRFLIARYNPSRHIDFDPGMGLLNLIDEFDKYRLAYYGRDTVSDEDFRRVYELSRIEGSESLQEISFRHLVNLIQIYPEEDKLFEALKRSGYGEEELDPFMKMRIEEATNWIRLYAPEQIRFTLLGQETPVDLSESEKHLVSDFIEIMDSITWDAENIHTSVHSVIKDNEMAQRDGFRVFYRILIGKERGPRLGYFLSNLNRESVRKRLEFAVG